MARHPHYFGDLSDTIFTLIQILTLDGAFQIARLLKEDNAIIGPVYVIIFVILGHIMLLKLILAVCSSAMHRGRPQCPDLVMAYIVMAQCPDCCYI